MNDTITIEGTDAYGNFVMETFSKLPIGKKRTTRKKIKVLDDILLNGKSLGYERNRMELGNMLFGHSRGEYPLTNRQLVNCKSWYALCKKAGVDAGYGHGENYGFDNDTFTIRPYWWGDDDAPEATLPNFLYKPTGFQIMWYKYAFRDSYMNQNLSDRQIKAIWKKCAESIDEMIPIRGNIAE